MKTLPVLDLLAPPPPPRAGRVLLGLGLLMLALALGWPGAPAPSPLATAGTAMLPQGIQRVGAVASPTVATPPLAPASPAPHATVIPDWADLFALLQRHGRGPVALLELTPQSSPGQIELVGQTPSLQSMVEWLQELEADPQLSDVTLTSHAARVAGQAGPAGGSTYRFVVLARWHAVETPAPTPGPTRHRVQGDNTAASPG